MKNSIYKITALCTVFMVLLSSCGDDELTPGGRKIPVTSAISGSATVDISPVAVGGYSIIERTGSTYAWSVSGVGTISGASNESSVALLFGSAGTTTLTVTETNDLGTAEPQTLSITSSAGALGVNKIITTSKVPLKENDTDAVVVVFDKELQTAPTFALAQAAGITTLGSLSSTTGTAIGLTDTTAYGLTKADYLGNGTLSAYFVTYTAGQGNGNPNIIVSGAVAAATWGGETMTTTDATAISTVDNTAPTGTLTLSADLAKNGDSDITITVTFSEAMDATSALTISSPATGTIDALASKAMTVDADDSKVWTTTYTPSTGDGVPVFTVTGATDLAGNSHGSINGSLTIDNTIPIIGSESAAEITSESNLASLSATSNEDGEVFYSVEQSSTVLESGSASASAGVANTFQTGVLTSGTYEVYFYSVDKAGNKGSRSTAVALVID